MEDERLVVWRCPECGKQAIKTFHENYEGDCPHCDQWVTPERVEAVPLQDYEQAQEWIRDTELELEQVKRDRDYFKRMVDWKPCPDCGGEGTSEEPACRRCKGWGRVSPRSEVESELEQVKAERNELQRRLDEGSLPRLDRALKAEAALSSSVPRERLEELVSALTIAREECWNIYAGAPEEEHIAEYQQSARNAGHLISRVLTALSPVPHQQGRPDCQCSAHQQEGSDG